MIRIVRSLIYRFNMKRLTDSLKRDILLRIRSQFERKDLEEARKLHEHEYVHPSDPLVSITIATYNRAEILVNRTLPSVFAQSYQNFEIIVVGDGCMDNTPDLINSITDPRLRFINLPERGAYPEDPSRRHFVAGTFPINRALQEVTGLWIAHLDDDEVWSVDHLEVLLRFAQSHSLEFVSGFAMVELAPGDWRELTSSSFNEAGGRNIHHSTVMFRTYLRLFKFDPKAWWYNMGGDWHTFMRMAYCGVKDGVVNRVVNEAPLRPGTTRPWALAEDRT